MLINPIDTIDNPEPNTLECAPCDERHSDVKEFPMSIRSRLASVAFAAALAFTVPALASAGADASVNIGSLYEPTKLYFGGGQGITEALHGNVYETLFKLNDDGSVSNLLASDVKSSADGLTYTVTLREGVKFHSGRALTAADVKASWQAVLAPNSLAARKSSYKTIQSIDVPDAKTLVFHLANKWISFRYALSYLWIVNPDNKDLDNAPDGTGAYKFDKWSRGSTLSLKRNDAYWGAKAKNAQVVFHYFTDASALSNSLLAGDIDIIAVVQSPDALAQFKNASVYKINDNSSTTKELLAFNDKVAPFDNVKVRKAIYSAIDRKKLLNSIWGGYGKLIGSMVPPTDPWYIDLANNNPYDPKLAKKLLTEAGFPNGLTFTLDTPTYDPHPTVAEFLVSELAKVNVTVKINSISADEWYTKVFQKRDFGATLQEPVNDRDVVWYGNPDFYWGYNNATVQQLVKESETGTAAEQVAKLTKVNQIISDEAASVWLYLYPQIVIAKTNVSGYPVHGLNSQFYAYDIVKN
jgi:peptide/nickel transport system substrate-binding protein